jgi:hypothetical protein
MHFRYLQLTAFTPPALLVRKRFSPVPLPLKRYFQPVTSKGKSKRQNIVQNDTLRVSLPALLVIIMSL